MVKSLEEIKDFLGYIERTYNNYRFKLRPDLDKPYGIGNPDLGYCWQSYDESTDTTTYNVVVADTGIERLNLRVTYHEYLHIYLDHLNEHLELDKTVSRVLKDERGEIADAIVKNCGLEESVAMSLVEAVLDDPEINHALHNYAEDMAVNSFIGLQGIQEMEEDIDAVSPNIKAQILEKYKNRVESKRLRAEIDDEIKRVTNQAKTKLVHPFRYHYPDGSSWEEGKTYGEYLLMLVRNLDQFLKSNVSRNQGRNGDTRGVSKKDMQNALSGGVGSLKDMMKSLGMLDDSGQSKDQDQGQDGAGGDGSFNDQENPLPENQIPPHDPSEAGGFRGDAEEEEHFAPGVRDPYFMTLSEGRKKDHYSESRKEADKKREVGEISAGGGRDIGNSGTPDFIRTVRATSDVDLAIDEVMMKYRKKVVKRTVVRDVMRNYNLGRCRRVIVPSIIERYRIDTNPKVTYIIDVSGSMDTDLIDRILNTIAHKMKYVNHGLKYDILTWSTGFGEWLKDIEPGKPIPKIHTGGGTRMAESLKFIKNNYDDSPVFILISDFADRLEEWKMVLRSMPTYQVYGFNYGCHNYKEDWPKNFTVKNFNKSYLDA